MADKPVTAGTRDLDVTEQDTERWARVGIERLSIPPINPKARSCPDESAEVDLTQDERQARPTAGQMRLGDGGLP